MIFRAIFWIGLVSLLMPHEPDLGYGRPGAAAGGIGSLIQSGSGACLDHAATCAGSLSLLGGFHTVAIRSLDEVRADLAANGTKLR
jgi:hypothetical protein